MTCIKQFEDISSPKKAKKNDMMNVTHHHNSQYFPKLCIHINLNIAQFDETDMNFLFGFAQQT